MLRVFNRDEKIYNYIGNQVHYSDIPLKFSQFNIIELIETGALVYNTFQRELLYFSKEEYDNWDKFLTEDCPEEARPIKEYLIRHWFIVDAKMNERQFCDSVDFVHRNGTKRKDLTSFNNYTIFTTLNCNAKCPYCYELGREKRTMDNDTAAKVGDFITKTAKGKVSLTWFGGEPLMNQTAITIILKKLIENNIDYNSSMITNGYLLDKVESDTIKYLWRLRNVQITFDGIDPEYSSIKGFEPGSFNHVLNNADRLLELGVKVAYRLNVSQQSASSIMALVDIFQDHYTDRWYHTKPSAYARPLFDDDDAWDQCISINNRLIDIGIGSIRKVRQPMKVANCMADSRKSIVITPEGTLSLCEHHTDEELIGSIYNIGEYKDDVVRDWNERLFTERCETCPLRPQCTFIKKCPSDFCTEKHMKHDIWAIRKAMVYAYEHRKEQ